MALLKTEDRPDYPIAYDPRRRDWCKQAMAATGQIKSAPYIFHSSGKLGSTIANRCNRGNAVIGADLRLEALDLFLARQKIFPGTQIAIARHDGLALAYHPAKAVLPPRETGGAPVHSPVGDLSPIFRELPPRLEAMGIDAVVHQSVTVSSEQWSRSIHPLRFEGIRQPLYLIIAIPDKELVAGVRALLQKSVLAIAIVMVGTLPLTWLLARTIAKPLRKTGRRSRGHSPIRLQPADHGAIALEVDDLAETLVAILVWCGVGRSSSRPIGSSILRAPRVARPGGRLCLVERRTNELPVIATLEDCDDVRSLIVEFIAEGIDVAVAAAS